MMSYDPFDAAMNPETREPTKRWFGQMFVEVWPCALVKGQGKVPFDANMHASDKRLTAVQMEVMPLSDYGVSFTLKRDMIAEFGGWPKITLPSIKALNADLRNLHESFVAVEFLPTGRKYPGNDGTEKEETTFVLVGTFADETACRAAYQEFNQVEADDIPFGNTVDTDKERTTAAMFIGPLWKQASGDVAKLQALLAGNPLTSKFFTLNSPEVIAAVGAE